MPYQPVPYRLPPMADDERRDASARFLEVMRQRRSVRAFAPDPVPMEIIDAAVEAAASGPSGANQQPWTFVVTDPQLRRRMHDDVLVHR